MGPDYSQPLSYSIQNAGGQQRVQYFQKLMGLGLQNVLSSMDKEKEDAVKERLLLRREDQKAKLEDLRQGYRLALLSGKFDLAKDLEKQKNQGEKELKMLGDALYEKGSRGALARAETDKVNIQNEYAPSLAQSQINKTNAGAASADALTTYRQNKLISASKDASKDPFYKQYLAASSDAEFVLDPKTQLRTISSLAPLADDEKKQGVIRSIMNLIIAQDPSLEEQVKQVYGTLPSINAGQ